MLHYKIWLSVLIAFAEDSTQVVLREQTLAAYRSGNSEECVTASKLFLDEDPHNAEVLNTQGLCLLQQGHAEAAAKALAAAVLEEPSSAKRAFYRINLAEAQKKRQRVKDALGELSQALADAPGDVAIEKLVAGLAGPKLYVKLKKQSLDHSDLGISLSLKTKYDSNIVLKPTEEIGTIRVSSVSGIVFPVRVQQTAKFSVLRLRDFSESTYLAYNFNANTSLSNYNTLDVGLNLAQELTDESDVRVSISNLTHYFFTNSAGLKGLLLENQLGPHATIVLNQSNQLGFDLALAYGSFVDDAEIEALRKTYFQTDGGARYTWTIDKRLSTTVQLGYLLHAAKSVDSTFAGPRADLKLTLRDMSFIPYARGGFKRLIYSESSPKRADSRFLAGIGIIKPWGGEESEPLKTGFELAAERNTSTSATNSYSKIEATFSISKSW